MRRGAAIGLLVAVAAGHGGAAAGQPPLDYALQCRGCHGPDGQGVAGGAPPFQGHLGRFVASPEGRVYVIRVPGVANSELDDAATAALLNWLVREFDAGNLPPDFAPFTTAEVAAHRRPALANPGLTRQQVLAARVAD